MVNLLGTSYGCWHTFAELFGTNTSCHIVVSIKVTKKSYTVMKVANKPALTSEIFLQKVIWPLLL